METINENPDEILTNRRKEKLNYSEDSATVIFHLFTTVYYFLCLFGAIVSDSWWGKFKTIVILSLVYIAGNLTLTAGAVPPFNLPARTFTFLGLALISLGGGGIKPCVAPFGGDQFKLPQQAKQLAWFFSIYYFAINFGAFISTIVTPIFRDDVKCFGDQDCFSLGFFFPACLMTISFTIFVLGKPLYILKPLEGNMMFKVSGAVWTGIKGKWNTKKDDDKKEHCETLTGNCVDFTSNLQFKRHEATGYYFTTSSTNIPNSIKFTDNPNKTNNGNPRIRVLANTARNYPIVIRGERTIEITSSNTTDFDFPKGSYSLIVNGNEINYFEFKLGGVYAILIHEYADNKFESYKETVSDPNTINILWIIPQYLVMTLGEVMFSVTGISFSFDEAPQSMKSVLNGCWQLTSAFGNIIIVIIAELPLFEEQAWEFLLFAVIMFIDSALFAWLAYRYKSIPHGEEVENTNDVRAVQEKREVDMNENKEVD
uniref:CSON004942 protein n=1 Tax=Culicoides sonorensis TaxID=179676 RepID=A0A336LY20_CULSO